MINRFEVLDYLNKYPVRREITDIVVHCSATKPGQKVDVDVIDGWHKLRGFSHQKESGRYCGYHFVVREDGSIQTGRFLNETGAHVQGANSHSIGVCYAGGLDREGKASDSRTADQKEALIFLLTSLVVLYPKAKIKGHRDYSPDLNGSGVIEPWEYMKQCPCFCAMDEYDYI
jgi:N-acetylmuramoyl-L-alanine amidase